MDYRSEGAVRVGAERHGLNRIGAVTKREHLVSGEHDANRALEFECRHHGEEELILRAQARPEGAADEGRLHADVAPRETEDLHDVLLAVLHPLRLVVDGEFAARFVDHGRGMQFNRVVVFDRNPIPFSIRIGAFSKAPRASPRGLATLMQNRFFGGM